MDIENAKKILSQGTHTCVLCRGEDTVCSNARGVKPLLDLWDTGTDCSGYSAADKVVGRATAFLYCLLGVKSLHAQVLSKPALQVLENARIAITWDTLVEGIRNRENTGPCPMEYATRDVQTPQQALEAIRQTLQALQS